MEDYPEAIYELDRDRKVVRVKDIARRMDVKMPSVSSMLKTPSRRGLVQYEKYEYVELIRDGLVDFMAFIRNCPRAGDSWLRFFEEYRLRGRIPEKCAEHGDDFVCEFRDRIEGPKPSES